MRAAAAAAKSGDLPVVRVLPLSAHTCTPENQIVWQNAKAFRILLALLIADAPAAAQTVERLYAPAKNLEQSELAQLETARRSVDVAMYSFIDRLLAEELATLARRGVHIRVYRDREQFSQEMGGGGITTTGILLAAGIEVRVKGARDLMHLKSYAADGHLLRTGSANWSQTELKRQDNDLIYETGSEAAGVFERTFEEMWARPSNTTVSFPQ